VALCLPVFFIEKFFLQLPDSSTIKSATSELREAFKSSNAIPELCTVLGASADPQVRQYAALLLRRKLQRPKVWAKMPNGAKANIKEGALQV